MLNALGDSLGDLASSNDDEDGSDEEYDTQATELGKLGENKEPGWVMGTMYKPVQHRIESTSQT